MKHCCDDKAAELGELRGRQARVLGIVLAINAAMFAVEAVGGLVAGSTALLADSLDMLGDASVYALTLWVLHRGARWRARAAMIKGIVMGAFGVGVLAQAALQLAGGAVPAVHTMGAIGALALAANIACLLFLYRHRSDDINLRSTWLCSRNDIIANVAVLGAAGMVAALDSGWPDILVGALIAALFLLSAAGIVSDARRELERAT